MDLRYSSSRIVSNLRRVSVEDSVENEYEEGGDSVWVEDRTGRTTMVSYSIQSLMTHKSKEHYFFEGRNNERTAIRTKTDRVDRRRTLWWWERVERTQRGPRREDRPERELFIYDSEIWTDLLEVCPLGTESSNDREISSEWDSLEETSSEKEVVALLEWWSVKIANWLISLTLIAIGMHMVTMAERNPRPVKTVLEEIEHQYLSKEESRANLIPILSMR